MGRRLDQGLTPREMQVAHLVRDGLTDREIAERLFITSRTAEWHLKQIFNKLGFNSRAQVAAWVAHDQAVDSKAGSSGEYRHNLPLQLTTFVGRVTELAEIRHLLATKRLVTLTATAGAGKTRLAIEVAGGTFGAYADGTWLVDLTPIRDGELVPRAFASALRVQERPRQPLAQTLLDHLSSRQVLLVVDNCEHVIQACAGFVDSILRQCPDVTILATTREPLRVSGEMVWRVPPLEIPPPGDRVDIEDLAKSEAVRLFLDRAQLAVPDFRLSERNAASVGSICASLDGLPLAIELAAARVSLMTPHQILSRLQDRFGLLTGGSRTGPTRHRTLQLALEWSHDLLSDPERALFRRLSVFAGSFSLEAIEHICSSDDLEVATITDLLGSLVDKSLVNTSGEAEQSIRFRMLETTREYARERLTECDEGERFSSRHLVYFVALAEERSAEARGAWEQNWHKRLAEDLSNLRLALEWSQGHEPKASLRLNCALRGFWIMHGLVQEGDSWFKRALAKYVVRDQLRAKALAEAGWLGFYRDDVGGASADLNESLDIYRELGDRRGVGQVLIQLGQFAVLDGDFATAHMYYNEGLALSRESDDARSIVVAVRSLGQLAVLERDHVRARSYLEEALSRLQQLGDVREKLYTLQWLGMSAIEVGDFDKARSLLEDALTISRELDFPMGISATIRYFAALAAASSQPARALYLGGASESLAESMAVAPIRMMRPLVHRWLEQSREELGDDRAATCWAEGRAMTRDRAIEYALSD
jgi:non-specific serine/threonine protein kinase